MIAGEAEKDPPERTLDVVLNRSAGLDRRGVEERLTAAMTEAGIAVRIETVDPAELERRLARLAGEKAEMVGVAGGDGTMLTAATVLAGGSTTLVTIPTGTLNHFSRRLGVDDVPAAAQAVRTGEPVTVPVGILDDRVFLNTATFGLYADMVRRRERMRKHLRKWPAAAVAFVMTLARLRQMDVTLVVEGKRLERTTALVWIGVGWGSFPFVHQAPERRAEADLEIVILKPASPAKMLALLLRLSVRVRNREQPIRDRALEIFHAQQLLIHADRRIGVTLDGEVFRSEPPILISVQHDALRVMAPPVAERSGSIGTPPGQEERRKSPDV